LLRKSWQRNAILLLLGTAVVGVAAMAVNDSTQPAEQTAPPPTNRTISDLDVPDLSVSGFRVGSLALSLVENLFFSTRSLLGDPDVVMTTTSVEPLDNDQSINSTTTSIGVSTQITTSTSPPTTTSPVTPATKINESQSVPGTSAPMVPTAPTTTSTSPPTTATTTTTTEPIPATTTTTLLISDEPSRESIERNNDPTIFGESYLDTWPSLEMWERMAWCESRNTWDVDTGNGYYGGLQFALGSWQWMGGEGNPSDATREEQIYRANLLWQAQGWNGWPGCKAYFGWSRWQISQ